MEIRKPAIIIAIIIILGGSLFAISSITGKAIEKDNTIKIGMIMPLTKTEYASVGVDAVKVAEMAVDEINAKGGVNEYKLRLIVEDNQFDPAMSVKAAHKLIDIDQIDVGIAATIGDSGSVMKIFEDNKVPLIFLIDSNSDIEDAGDYVFSIGFSTELSGRQMADFAYNNLSIRNAAIIHSQDAWAEMNQRYFSQRFEEPPLRLRVIRQGSI